MTQSDAPNEGREEKTAKQFLLDNGASDTLYIMYAPDGINLSEGERIEQAMRDFSQQENKHLRDQLSKERENVKDWKEKYERLNKDWTYTQNERSKERETIKEKNAWIAEERTINKELAAENRKLESELIEEREMRKELVSGLQKLLSRFTPASYEWLKIKSMIAKASDLDKNQ